MRFVRFLALGVLMVLLFAPTGCYSFGILRSDLPPSPLEEESKVVLRVTPTDGASFLVRKPWVNGRLLGGVVDSKPREISLTDVDLIEEKFYDRRKTGRFIAYLVGISLGVLGWEASGGF